MVVVRHRDVGAGVQFVRYADLALRYQDTLLGHLFGVSARCLRFCLIQREEMGRALLL